MCDVQAQPTNRSFVSCKSNTWLTSNQVSQVDETITTTRDDLWLALLCNNTHDTVGVAEKSVNGGTSTNVPDPHRTISPTTHHNV